MTEIEFTDRYSAMGIKPPSLYTVCRDQCEGTGYVPVYVDPDALDDEDSELLRRWFIAEAAASTDDGWHFVTCPGCEGSGRTKGLLRRARQAVWAVGRDWQFARSHVLVRPYSADTAAQVLADRRAVPLEVAATGDPLPGDGVPYGDRLDVDHPWMWNRRIALRVLLRR